MSRDESFASLPPRQRISQIVQGWMIREPLMFAAWTQHVLCEKPDIATIRVGEGRIEFNSKFVASLQREELRQVMAVEAMRILLGHPYSRRQPRGDLSFQASNLAVQECLRTPLPIPRARDVLGDPADDRQYFEYYYRRLVERCRDHPDELPPDKRPDFDQDSDDRETNDPAGSYSGASDQQDGDQQDRDQSAVGDRDGASSEVADQDAADDEAGSGAAASPDQSEDSGSDLGEGDRTESEGTGRGANDLESYAEGRRVGWENSAAWQDDDLRRDEIAVVLREAAESEGWGSVGGRAKEQLLANLRPQLDYRGVLRGFRQSVLSTRRRLTRTRPSRRYGFRQMGSRYSLTTNLLVAVDVSGSMGSDEIRSGLSVIRQFFRYGMESVDVICFDDQIRSDVWTLRRAPHVFEVAGRGGTDFRPVIEFIDQHPGYDGLIIFTDGYAPLPPGPKNRRTRVLWLYRDEATYRRGSGRPGGFGRSAFLRPSRRDHS
ncbi:hypothetical protein FYK55_06810 [Roseiconus nitratireducens]|uniref:VWA-like domain-containing protein n=1 Tax=Roseiconus nitratireducens TaxID=2605748 RepID=A0A5M6DCR4_9BACT|nr:VWA-like domain-containing protein [Roseiconus nitratireducens]KAA5545357.1 hypothetical protein FYK55_06810 [Roseiconus nitratireducens]